jgi:lipopolysaccharide transport system ATP-binding protein
MSNTVIEVINLSKKYRLGLVGSDTIADDIKRYWARIRGKDDPTLLFGQTNTLNIRQKSKGKTEKADYIWALRDISFSVKQGEVLGIIGKNGAGKSTLLKILSKVTSPTQGNVKIKGRIASLLEVGTGFQGELTGRENIFLNGAILGMTKTEIRSKLDEIIDFSGIERYIDTPVKRYSSGMYVRLAFAVAAHLEPEILILDEVLAVGDAEFQKKCLGKMSDVSEKQGRTVLFVSHNLTAISNLCNRVILLDRGAIITDGSSKDAIEKYSETQIKQTGFLEWSSINIAPGYDNVKLKSIRIWSNGVITSEIDIQDNFILEFEYWNLKPDINLTFFIQITDTLGAVLFGTANLDSINLVKDNWANKKYSPGLYKTTCSINKNMLNTGLYSINISLNSDITQHEIFERDILTFSIVDRKGYCKEYSCEWAGFFRPKLQWETQKLDESDDRLFPES